MKKRQPLLLVQSLQAERQTLCAMAKRTQKGNESATYKTMVATSKYLTAQIMKYLQCSYTTEV